MSPSDLLAALKLVGLLAAAFALPFLVCFTVITVFMRIGKYLKDGR